MTFLSPDFAAGPQIEFVGPRVARLPMQLPIRLGDRRRTHQDAIPRRATSSGNPLAHPFGIDACVNYQMRNVDVSQAELPRHALSNGSKPEFGASESGVAVAAAHARRRTGEEDRAPPVRQHPPRRLPPGEEARVAG